MSNALISFYHNLEEPIVIYDKKQDILYHNLSFKKIFGDFNNSKGFDCLSKLSYKFYYQMCFLKSEDLKTYNPIISAITKNINFTTYASYQMLEDKFYHFMIKSFSIKNRYRIVYFYDITDELKTLDDVEHSLIPHIKATGPVRDHHDLLNIPIANSGMPEQTALAEIANLMEHRPCWTNYVIEISDWLIDKKAELGI